MLGTTTGLSNVNFNQTLYLGVNVAADGEMTPRKVLGAVPAAMMATAVSGSTTPSSFGTTTPLANTQVTMEATTPTAIPFSIRAASGQSANLFNVQNSAASNLLYVSAGGGLFASSTLQVTALSTFYGGLLVNNATSTITNLTAVTASTTNLYVTGVATSTFAGSLAVTEANATSTFAGGIDLSDGCFALDGNCLSSGSSNWTDAGLYLTPLTASDGILINSATSTIINLTMTNATSTNATTTALYVSNNINLASGLAYNINGANVLNATTLGAAVTASSLTSVGTLSALTVSGLSTLSGGLLVNNATSTVTNLTMTNATSTNATTTTLYASDQATASYFTAESTSIASTFPYASTTQLSTSNKLFIANGTAAAPSFTFTSDVDTGIYRNTVTGGLDVADEGVGVVSFYNGATLFNNIALSGISTLGATGLATLSGGLLVNNATSTITNLTTTNATSTNATTTNIYVSGSPTIGGGLAVYSVKATSTIPNNTPFAWTIATSTTAKPLFQVNTT